MSEVSSVACAGPNALIASNVVRMLRPSVDFSPSHMMCSDCGPASLVVVAGQLDVVDVARPTWSAPDRPVRSGWCWCRR